MYKVVLASASPRRRDLLTEAGISFEVVVSDVDENIVMTTPPLFVKELALLKAASVAGSCKGCNLVIGADTIVCIDGEVLGKPVGYGDARRMLKRLSGRIHQVYTGVCIIDSVTGKAVCRHDVTCVAFRHLSNKDIRDYVKTREPLDKAGAYGIQGLGGKLVRGIKGSYDNVVGLPMQVVWDILKTEFDYQKKINI